MSPIGIRPQPQHIAVGIRPIGDGGVSATNTLEHQRNQWIDSMMSTPKIGANVVSNFLVESNAATKGVDISFALTGTMGVDQVILSRGDAMDISQATVVQSWAADVKSYTYSDSAQVLQQFGQVFYWLTLTPVNKINGTKSQVGPQFLLLNPSLLPPPNLKEVSAAHDAAANGTVLVTCNVDGLDAGNSVKIYLTGYNGNPAAVAVAQRTTTPLQFTASATGETVTIRAKQVSQGGTESASGPTCTLTLSSPATVPAKPEGVSVAQIATGNQIMWPASLEAGITGYQLYRGQRGEAFGSATLLTTITGASSGTVEYLDTGGLAGDYQYFVIAQGSSGNSTNSNAANPQILFSSSVLPPNSTANQFGGATLDSQDGGTSATIRIYGSGGPGTSWSKVTGYGTATRPAGSITGLSYSARFYVLYEVASATYLASTSYTDTLPDGYEWIGTILTAPSGGSGSLTATATAAIDGSGHVVSVTSTQNGYGYGSASVAISGGGGSGATATATCANGMVVAYTVTYGGGGYTSAPSVTVTQTSPYSAGGGGTQGSGSRYVLST